jgi:hypothetical protein
MFELPFVEQVARNKQGGTDQRSGVSSDHQAASAVGGHTGHNVIGASASLARHAAKGAESARTRSLMWQSWERTGRPGVRAW